MIFTVEQMFFEKLMKYASEGSESNFEWQAVPDFGSGNAEGPGGDASFRSARLVEPGQKNASILSVHGRRGAPKGILAGGVDVP